MSSVKILGFGGSLRRGSFNRMLMEAAAQLAPGEAEVETYDITNLPLFNEDDEKNPPAPILDFKNKLSEADAIYIATPEYNYSVPGYLKNAIDVGSRYGENPFDEKPVALMSASIGMMGGSRAQYHLRQSFVFLNAKVITRPEVFINFAGDKFNEDGELQDDVAKDLIVQLLENLVREVLIRSEA